MNLQTITMPKEKALEAYRQYREHARTQRDRAITIGYRAIASGKAIINPREAITRAGFDELWRPRLAIAQATMEQQLWSCGITGGSFRRKPYWRWEFAPNIVSPPRQSYADYRTMVPLIPPNLRPGETQLKKYWILWEATWEEAPRDPMLLRHLAGDLYIVLAAWDLTDLERAAMGTIN
mgnify:CR=1 FL=1